MVGTLFEPSALVFMITLYLIERSTKHYILWKVSGCASSRVCEILTLKVLVATIDALGHFETG